jgi:hypothetical protein
MRRGFVDHDATSAERVGHCVTDERVGANRRFNNIHGHGNGE